MFSSASRWLFDNTEGKLKIKSPDDCGNNNGLNVWSEFTQINFTLSLRSNAKMQRIKQNTIVFFVIVPQGLPQSHHAPQQEK